MMINPELSDEKQNEERPSKSRKLGKYAFKAAIFLSSISIANAEIPSVAIAQTQNSKIEHSAKSESHTETSNSLTRQGHIKYYDTSMFAGWNFNITHVGCGMTAASNAISFAKQKFINPDQVAEHSYPWYNNGLGKEAKDNIDHQYHYMNGLGPQLAKQYHIRYVQETLEQAAYDVTVNHAGAIILAKAGPHDTFTDDSHYMTIEQSVGEKVRIEDPNQPGHGQNNTLWTIPGLEANGVYDTAWVFFPNK